MKASELNDKFVAADLYEMANLDGRDAGLDVVVFCSPDYNSRHSCRVKVSNKRGKMTPDDVFVIDMTNFEIVAGVCKLNSDDLESVKVWLYRNKDIIQKYWDNEISTREFVLGIKKIK